MMVALGVIQIVGCGEIGSDSRPTDATESGAWRFRSLQHHGEAAGHGAAAGPKGLRRSRAAVTAAARSRSEVRRCLLENRVVEEERNPFPGFGTISRRSAEQSHTTSGVADEFRLAEAGDVIPVARFIHSVHKCFHGAATLRGGVGQWRGMSKILFERCPGVSLELVTGWGRGIGYLEDVLHA